MNTFIILLVVFLQSYPLYPFQEYRTMNKWKQAIIEELEARIIEPDEARKAIEQHNGQRIHNFDYYLLQHEGTKTFGVYELDDGRCIIIDEKWDDFGEQWVSCQALAEEIQRKDYEMKGGYKWIHPLKEMPLGDDFFTRIPSLVDSLPSLLCMEKDALDGTLESLHQIDIVLSELDITHEDLVELFPHLIAYCGEVLIQQSNGRWRKELWPPLGKTVEHIAVTDSGAYIEKHTEIENSNNEQRTENIWEPYILSFNGELLDPWDPVYMTLFDIQNDTATLYGRIYRQLYKWKKEK